MRYIFTFIACIWSPYLGQLVKRQSFQWRSGSYLRVTCPSKLVQRTARLPSRSQYMCQGLLKTCQDQAFVLALIKGVCARVGLPILGTSEMAGKKDAFERED